MTLIIKLLLAFSLYIYNTCLSYKTTQSNRPLQIIIIIIIIIIIQKNK